MGALDYLSRFCSVTSATSRRKRRKPLQTVELKVKMDCDGCERRVTEAAWSMKGVTAVEVSRKQSRVTVTGHVDRSKVLRRVRRAKRTAEFWPYVPYNLVLYPYAAGAYDKKAPAGYVRDAPQAMPAGAADEGYVALFSDDNPNACSVM